MAVPQCRTVERAGHIGQAVGAAERLDTPLHLHRVPQAVRCDEQPLLARYDMWLTDPWLGDEPDLHFLEEMSKPNHQNY